MNKKIQKKVENIRDYLETRQKLLGMEFDEKRHIHKNKKTGDIYGGSSTISGKVDKPWLMPWALKEMYKYLKSNWKCSKKYSGDEKEKLLKEAKKASQRKAILSAERGTIIHHWLEHYCNTKEILTGEDIRKQYEDEELEIDDLKQLDEEEIPNVIEDHIDALSGFVSWFEYRDVHPIITEMIVADHEHKIAGILDLLAIIKHKGNYKIALIDHKTSNIVGKTALLQTAGYQMMLEKMGINPKIRIILQYGDDDTRGRYDNPAFREIIVPDNYKFEKEVFLAQNKIRKYESYYKNKIKDKI
ncbi:MAG: PD-(D/E)XK nuclease family protein [Elusimicrobiota bacterium]